MQHIAHFTNIPPAELNPCPPLASDPLHEVSHTFEADSWADAILKADRWAEMYRQMWHTPPYFSVQAARECLGGGYAYSRIHQRPWVTEEDKRTARTAR